MYSQDEPQKRFKKYSLVTKGMKLTEIDEDGDPINMGNWSIKKNKQQKPFTKIYGEKTGDLAITAANNPYTSLADKKVPESLSKLDYALHSTLIHGWGQWKNERKGKASFFFFAGLGSLVYYG